MVLTIAAGVFLGILSIPLAWLGLMLCAALCYGLWALLRQVPVFVWAILVCFLMWLAGVPLPWGMH